VVARGGFANGVGRRGGIKWARDIFPKMRNYTHVHKMTSVGNDLIGHYRTYLASYEVEHPADVTGTPSVGAAKLMIECFSDGLCVSERTGVSVWKLAFVRAALLSARLSLFDRELP
jgi:hypothetical protein